jgi:hypothetical protein
MIRGISVRVYSPAWGAADAHGNRAKAWADPVTVSNVLVAPAGTEDIGGDAEPNSDEVVVTLTFPKGTDAGILRGAKVEIDGQDFFVRGAPRAYPAELCPTAWNISAEAVADV